MFELINIPKQFCVKCENRNTQLVKTLEDRVYVECMVVKCKHVRELEMMEDEK